MRPLLEPAQSSVYPDRAVAGSPDRAAARRAVAGVGCLLFVSMIPVTMLVAPLKELVADAYGSGAFWTHSFMSVNMLGAVFAAPWTRSLADRPGHRRRVAAVALSIDGVLLAAMAWMPSLASLLILRFFEGVAHILAVSTLMGIAAGWAPRERRGATMGIVGAAMMFGTACGTRLGGLDLKGLPFGIFEAAGAVSLAAALLVALFVREAARFGAGGHPRGRLGELMRERRVLWVPYAYAFIDRLCVGVITSTFVLFLADIHNLGPADRSRLLLDFLIPFALLIYPAGRLVDRWGRVWALALGSILFGVLFAGYGWVGVDVLPGVMVLSGVISAIMFAPNLALCADLSPPSQRGAAYLGFNIAGSFGLFLGPLLAGACFHCLAGWTTELSAYRWTLFGAGTIEVLCASATLPLLLRLKSRGLTA